MTARARRGTGTACVGVILAGGVGSRFWPLSRRHRPKQLLALGGGTRSLLRETAERVLPIVGWGRLLVVTGRHVAPAIRRQLPHLPPANLLVEPQQRNTAAAVGLAAVTVRARWGDAVQLVLPADHLVGNVGEFRASARRALRWAATHPVLVTMGVKPTRVETGYGYIRVGRPLAPGIAVAARFCEKPSRRRAESFVRGGRYLWNSGIFCWRTSTILGAIDAHLPVLAAALRRVGACIGRPRAAKRAVAREYRRLPAISVDHGVLERVQTLAVVRTHFRWSDVGSWAAVTRPATAAGGRTVAVDAPRLAVHGGQRLVAVVGLPDLIVVDHDDALLICRRDRAQEVRRVVREIERRGWSRYL